MQSLKQQTLYPPPICRGTNKASVVTHVSQSFPGSSPPGFCGRAGVPGFRGFPPPGGKNRPTANPSGLFPAESAVSSVKISTRQVSAPGKTAAKYSQLRTTDKPESCHTLKNFQAIPVCRIRISFR